MAEIQIKPNIFISVVTKEQWQSRMETLTGEDKRDFLEKCNPFSHADHKSLVKMLGISLVDLHNACKDLDQDFDVDQDYYTVRYSLKQS